MTQGASDRKTEAPDSRVFPLSRVPSWLRSAGTSAWFLLGLIALTTVAYFGLARVSALVIPLVVAVVLGMIFHPLVDRVESTGLPRGVGATAVMLGIAGVIALAVWLAVKGVIDQWDQIVEQVELGWIQIQGNLADFGASTDGLRDMWNSVSGGGAATSGVSGALQAGFSGAASFAIGTFIGAFLLFYLLKDWHELRGWAGRHAGVPESLGSGLIEDATTAIRRYFYGITLAAVPVALTIGIAMWILGLPLVAAVILVTFVTSYIPYLGAIFSGAFTVLVALGSGGLTDAIIMLIVVLLTQNGLQTIVQTKFTSDQLSLHPIVNLGSTIVGASLAGLLGATLSAPIVAMVISAHKRVRSFYAESATDDGSAEVPEPADTQESPDPRG